MATVQELRQRVRVDHEHAQADEGDGARRSARLRRAQERIEAMRSVRRPDARADGRHGARQRVGASLPLARSGATSASVAIVPVTGDRGLAGAFNAQILRRAIAALTRELERQGVEVHSGSSVGRKGASTLRFRRYERAQAAGPASATTRSTGTRRRSRTGSPSSTSNEDVDRVVLVSQPLRLARSSSA